MERKQSKCTIYINIQPKHKDSENVLITEYIPKEIANDVSDIDFTFIQQG